MDYAYVWIISFIIGLSGLYFYRRNPSIKIISIDGNIGAGKSTLIRTVFPQLRDNTGLNIYIADEPVDQWTCTKSRDGKNILEYFYEDKERWAYTFQNYAFVTRCLNIKGHIQKIQSNYQWWNPFVGKYYYIFTERSPMTDYHLFFQMLYDDGYLSDIEYNVYVSWFKLMKDGKHLDAIIYIKSPVDLCHERISMRDRSGEHLIAKDYLVKLEQYHNRWFKNVDIPILTLDGKNILDDNQISSKINNFLHLRKFKMLTL